MAVHCFDISRSMCLTCQYFNAERSIVTFGPKVGIAHGGGNGHCSIGRNQYGEQFPRNWGFRPVEGAAGCHYKRWLELP